MKRREFAFRAAAAAGAFTMGGAARAQARPPENGREFRTLDKRVPVEAPPGKIELVDFFWYSCPHCNAFEPVLQAWSKRLPDDVVLRRVPAAFREDMIPQQRLFFALDVMGRVNDLHVKIFDAVHKERLALATLPAMQAWLAQHGVDPAKFADIYNSFTTNAKVRRAIELQDAYAVEGVPAFGIAGRYYTDPTIAGDIPRFVRTAEYLIGRARDQR